MHELDWTPLLPPSELMASMASSQQMARESEFKLGELMSENEILLERLSIFRHIEGERDDLRIRLQQLQEDQRSLEATHKSGRIRRGDGR